MASIQPFFVAVCQAEKTAVRSGGPAKYRENIEKNLDRFCGLIDYCCAGNLAGRDSFAIAGPVKLITFGEFAITGAYMAANPGERRFNNRDVIKHLAIRMPGPETDVLAGKAKQYGVYIAAVNFEADPDWPDFHFNTGFIINPEGRIILKYRKTLTNQPVEISCSPHDIMDRYKNPITGKFDPFPVVETSIGRLAVMVCNDLNAPEIPRIYSMKGAEVVMHLTSGLSSSAAGWHPRGVIEALKRARAYDNAVYFVVSDWGPETGATFPRCRNQSRSAVFDYTGKELARAEDSNEIVVRASLNIEAARQYRSQFYKNPLSMVRSELYAPYFSKTIYPPNTFLKHGPVEETLNEVQCGYFNQAVENLNNCQDYYSERAVP
ncbi:MAG: nitrilase-related carbon-nitrogen hydrolase [Chloroflexota bacterium]